MGRSSASPGEVVHDQLATAIDVARTRPQSCHRRIGGTSTRDQVAFWRNVAMSHREPTSALRSKFRCHDYDFAAKVPRRQRGPTVPAIPVALGERTGRHRIRAFTALGADGRAGLLLCRRRHDVINEISTATCLDLSISMFPAHMERLSTLNSSITPHRGCDRSMDRECVDEAV